MLRAATPHEPNNQTRALSRLGRLRSHAAQLRSRLHIKALPLAHSTCLHKQLLSSTKQPNLTKNRCPALSLSHLPSASTNLCSNGCKSSAINAEHTRRLTRPIVMFTRRRGIRSPASRGKGRNRMKRRSIAVKLAGGVVYLSVLVTVRVLVERRLVLPARDALAGRSAAATV